MQPDIIFEGIEFFNIDGFIGRYALSKCGKMYSYFNEGYKSLQTDKDGYQTVSLIKDGTGYKSRVRFHRLMAETFMLNLYNKPCINHIDGNRMNNSIENLEWCTVIENNKHARSNPEYETTLGKKQSFMTNEIKLEVLRLHAEGISNISIGKRLNIHKVSIGRFLKSYEECGALALVYKKPRRVNFVNISQ